MLGLGGGGRVGETDMMDDIIFVVLGKGNRVAWMRDMLGGRNTPLSPLQFSFPSYLKTPYLNPPTHHSPNGKASWNFRTLAYHYCSLGF